MRIMIVVLALVAAGCGSAIEGLTEEAIERGLEASGEDVGDVDIDLDEDSGEFRVESDDGTFSVGGGEVPDGLELDLPDGGEVVSSLTTPDLVQVSLQYPGGQFDDLVDFYDQRLADWDRSESTFTNDGTEIRNVSWRGEENQTFAQVVTCFDTDGEATLACVTVAQDVGG